MSDTAARVKIRKLREAVDQKGHWMRHFSPRAEPWPEVDVWALQRGYSLVDVRGPHRLYVKPLPGGSRIFVDIREREGELALSAWIRFGFWVRVAYCFRLPRETSPLTSGLTAAISRRRACHDLNALLVALRQAVITGSLSWHIGDLEPSTLWLAALSLLPVVIFSAAVLPDIEWRWKLLPVLAAFVFRKILFLLLSALLLVVGYEMLRRRYLSERWMRVTTVSALVILLFGANASSLWRSRTALAEVKIAYYCLTLADRDGCLGALTELSGARRERFLMNLETLTSYLARRSH